MAAPFREQYYSFKGETIKLAVWKAGMTAEGEYEGIDRTCARAMTKYGATDKVCRMNTREAIDIALAQARVKIKHAQAKRS